MLRKHDHLNIYNSFQTYHSNQVNNIEMTVRKSKFIRSERLSDL